MVKIKKSIKSLIADGLSVRGVRHQVFFIKGEKEYTGIKRINSEYTAYVTQLENERPSAEILREDELIEFFDDILVIAYPANFGDLTPISEVNDVFLDQLRMYADDWHFAHVFDDGCYFSVMAEYEINDIPKYITHVVEIGK